MRGYSGMKPMHVVRRWPASSWDRIAIAAIALGVVLRGVWELLVHPPLNYLYSDMGGYVDRARELAQGVPLNRYDAFFPPGTHLSLALPLRLVGVFRAGLWADSVLWFALASLAPLLIWLLARTLLAPPAAALTALFCALWSLQITHGGFFTSETPALTFLLAALWLGYLSGRAPPRRALWLGALCRPPRRHGDRQPAAARTEPTR